MLLGCDQGHQDDQATGGPPVHITATNVGSGVPLDGNVEIAFDRLLSPNSITRQTFILSDKNGASFTPEIAYDPVARVVTISPGAMLQDQDVYQVRIVAPQSASDPNGLRALDGATLDPAVKPVITFIAGANAPKQVVPPAVDFCKDIFRLFDKCAGAACHTSRAIAAEGLLLDSPAHVTSTAVNRVSQESNTGPRSVAAPAGLRFGIDMPILDPGTGSPATGDPAHSFMLYKLLMAVPLDKSTTQQPGLCDGGMPAPPAMGPMHSVAWLPLSDGERARLSNMVPGREMPYPGDPKAPLDQPVNTLTLDELELVNRWIAQTRTNGEPLVPAACPSCIP